MFDLSGMTYGLQRTVMMLGFDWNFFFVIIQSVLLKLMIKFSLANHPANLGLIG